MARHIKEILEELFKGRDAALEKYAKVRMTQYEMNLWRIYAHPLSDVAGTAKQYFSKRFLDGQKIDTASEKDLKNAFERLGFAVSNGCKNRCTELVKELNEALKELRLDGINDIDGFLDWLTFYYFVVKDFYGNPAICPRYGHEIRIFIQEKNRKEFWYELQSLLKAKRMMSMQEVGQIVSFKRKHSKPLGE